MMEQLRLDEQERRQAAREGRQVNDLPSGNGGYWAYMQRQMQERTRKLGLMGENMDRLEENSNSWANDVNKYMQSQKRKAVLGGKFSNF
jgi:syntaxin-binding protein 5